MTYFTTWEEFTKAAERLYTADPMKVAAQFVLYAASILLRVMHLFTISKCLGVRKSDSQYQEI